MKFIITTPFPLDPNEPLEVEIDTDIDDPTPRTTAMTRLGLTIWTENEYKDAAERMKDTFPFPDAKPIDKAREEYFMRKFAASVPEPVAEEK